MILDDLPNDTPGILSPAIAKILCAYTAYKNHKNIAQFWHQVDENGSITALIGCVNGYVSLWSDNSDKEELLSFLKFISPIGIFTHLDTAENLNLKINEKCFCFFKKPPFEKLTSPLFKEPRELLFALRQGLDIPDGDGFVADVSFRKYHGCADYVVEEGGGALIYFNEKSAILNGIAVPKNSQRKGLGSHLLNLVLSLAENRVVYACCTEKNKNFYLKNGFSYFDEAAYCEEK